MAQFKIVDTAKELINDLNAKTGTVRAIVNYEKIRGRKSKAKDDEAKKGKMPNTLIEYLMEHPQRFSMVLCDEAHKMRNRETQTYKGAEVLMNLADTALFLTATPVMISQENLYNLLHLLDNSRFFRYDIFENHMAENRPFIKALSQVNNSVPLKKIKEQLLVSEVRQHYYSNEQEIYSENTTIQEIFKQDPIFLEIMELCDGEDNTKVRARLQYLFSSMSMMNSVFSRTRKREVTTDFSQTERKPHPVRIDLTEINANRQSAFTSDLNQICINLREDLKKEFKKQSELPIQRLTDALSARPLVYSGGGSTFGKLRQPHLGFRDIIHISEKEWNSVAIKDMDIIRSRNLCPILSTAYGLSISVTDDKIRCKSFRDIFDEVRKWTVEKKPKKYVYGGSISSDGFDYGIDWDALK